MVRAGRRVEPRRLARAHQVLLTRHKCFLSIDFA